MTYPLRTLVVVTVISLIVGFTMGLLVGYSKNSKLADQLKPIQIIGVAMFTMYVLLARQPDSVIAVGILALIPGEYIGKKVGDAIDRRDK